MCCVWSIFVMSWRKHWKRELMGGNYHDLPKFPHSFKLNDVWIIIHVTDSHKIVCILCTNSVFLVSIMLPLSRISQHLDCHWITLGVIWYTNNVVITSQRRVYFINIKGSTRPYKIKLYKKKHYTSEGIHQRKVLSWWNFWSNSKAQTEIGFWKRKPSQCLGHQIMDTLKWTSEIV